MRWIKHIHKINKQQISTTCLIKYEINDNLCVLNCLHRYHTECVDIWLEKIKIAPIVGMLNWSKMRLSLIHKP